MRISDRKMMELPPNSRDKRLALPSGGKQRIGGEAKSSISSCETSATPNKDERLFGKKNRTHTPKSPRSSSTKQHRSTSPKRIRDERRPRGGASDGGDERRRRPRESGAGTRSRTRNTEGARRSGSSDHHKRSNERRSRGGSKERRSKDGSKSRGSGDCRRNKDGKDRPSRSSGHRSSREKDGKPSSRRRGRSKEAGQQQSSATEFDFDDDATVMSTATTRTNASATNRRPRRNSARGYSFGANSRKEAQQKIKDSRAVVESESEGGDYEFAMDDDDESLMCGGGKANRRGSMNSVRSNASRNIHADDEGGDDDDTRSVGSVQSTLTATLGRGNRRAQQLFRSGSARSLVGAGDRRRRPSITGTVIQRPRPKQNETVAARRRNSHQQRMTRLGHHGGNQQAKAYQKPETAADRRRNSHKAQIARLYGQSDGDNSSVSTDVNSMGKAASRVALEFDMEDDDAIGGSAFPRGAFGSGNSIGGGGHFQARRGSSASARQCENSLMMSGDHGGNFLEDLAGDTGGNEIVFPKFRACRRDSKSLSQSLHDATSAFAGMAVQTSNSMDSRHTSFSSSLSGSQQLDIDESLSKALHQTTSGYAASGTTPASRKGSGGHMNASSQHRNQSSKKSSRDGSGRDGMSTSRHRSDHDSKSRSSSRHQTSRSKRDDRRKGRRGDKGEVDSRRKAREGNNRPTLKTSDSKGSMISTEDDERNSSPVKPAVDLTQDTSAGQSAAVSGSKVNDAQLAPRSSVEATVANALRDALQTIVPVANTVGSLTGSEPSREDAVNGDAKMPARVDEHPDDEITKEDQTQDVASTEHNPAPDDAIDDEEQVQAVEEHQKEDGACPDGETTDAVPEQSTERDASVEDAGCPLPPVADIAAVVAEVPRDESLQVAASETGSMGEEASIGSVPESPESVQHTALHAWAVDSKCASSPGDRTPPHTSSISLVSGGDLSLAAEPSSPCVLDRSIQRSEFDVEESPPQPGRRKSSSSLGVAESSASQKTLKTEFTMSEGEIPQAEVGRNVRKGRRPAPLAVSNSMELELVPQDVVAPDRTSAPLVPQMSDLSLPNMVSADIVASAKSRMTARSMTQAQRRLDEHAKSRAMSRTGSATDKQLLSASRTESVNDMDRSDPDEIPATIGDGQTHIFDMPSDDNFLLGQAGDEHSTRSVHTTHTEMLPVTSPGGLLLNAGEDEDLSEASSIDSIATL